MKRLGTLIEREWSPKPGCATYEQCQKAWALLIANNFEPRWIDDMPRAQATRLITRLLQIQEQKKLK